MPFESNHSEPSPDDADGGAIVTVAALPNINTRDLRLLAAMPTDGWVTRSDLAERTGVPLQTVYNRIDRLSPWYRTSRRQTIGKSVAYQRTVSEVRITFDRDTE